MHACLLGFHLFSACAIISFSLASDLCRDTGLSFAALREGHRPVSLSVLCLPVLSLFVESDPSSALTVFMQPDVVSTFS